LSAVTQCNAPKSYNHLSAGLLPFTFTANMLNLWYCPVTMSPCYLSPMIYSCQLSVSDNSFTDGQPSHNENSCSFLCCLWLPSSSHLVYLMFWSPEIETSWLMHVPQMHLILPLSSMSAKSF
jgi:hypothetical protein